MSVTHPPLTISEIDAKLDAWVDDPDKFAGRVKRWARRLNREDRELEVLDPSAWRKPQHEMSGVATIEDQLRAEIDSILIMEREEEAQHARRLELAKIRFELSLEQHGLEAEDVDGRVCYDPQTFRDVDAIQCEIPTDLCARWKEYHALRTELVERNLYLVLINVERYAHLGVPRLDLVQEGSASLFRAVDGFDWRRGLLFRTYAVHWLNQAFRSFLYNHGQTVRVPVYLQKAMRHVKAAIARLGDPAASPDRIAEMTGLGVHIVESALSAMRSTLSMDAGTRDDDSAGLSDSLGYEDPEGLYDVSMEDVTLEDGLGAALDRLSERERFVVERRYGLGDHEEQTLSEVASQMGVSLERVRQIQMRALGKLRTPTLRKAIDPFL